MSNHIWRVRAPEREDDIYLFEVHGDAEAFAEALTRDDEPFAVGVEDVPVNRGDGAGALIAAERGDRIEEAGMPAVAEDVREGLGLPVVLGRLAAIGEPDPEVAASPHRWRDEDERRVGIGATHTVIGVYEEDGQRFAEVFADVNPAGAKGQAMAWAHEQVGSPEIIIAGVVAGAATLVDEVA